MSLDENFANAAKEVANFKTVESDDIFATFYSLYKQATVGDVSGAATGTDSRSVAKFNAWSKLKGTSKEAAKEAYVKKYNELKGSYGK